MPANVTTPFSGSQFQGWASFYGGNVQAPAPPPPSAFGASALGQAPSNGQYTGGWAYPDAWANFYEGKQGFNAPQNQNSPAGALAATNYANNINNPNDPNLLGWEQAYGNPQTILAQDQNWAQSLGSAPTNTPSNQLTGGWQNPEAWAAYYGGTNGFTAPQNAGSPASALEAAAQIAQTSSPQSNPALLGWVQDYGQPGSVLANTPNWAASLGAAPVNAQGQGVNPQGGWESPLAWAAYYGGFQGFNGAVDNTLQAAQNWAGVTNANDPSLLGWELDYGNPQTVVSALEGQNQAATAQQAQLQQQADAVNAQLQQQFQQQQAAFNAQQAQIAAQQAQIASLTSQEQALQARIAQLQRTDPQGANAYISQLQGIQSQLGQAQTQLSAQAGSGIQAPPSQAGAALSQSGGFTNPAQTIPGVGFPADANLVVLDPITGSPVLASKLATQEEQDELAISSAQLQAPHSHIAHFGFANQPGSGVNVPSFGTNDIQGAGGASGAFGLGILPPASGAAVGGDPFNALYNYTNTTFAQAFTAGETQGGQVPPGGPIAPLFGGKGGEGSFGGGFVEDPYRQAQLSGIDLGPEPHFLGIPQSQFLGSQQAAAILSDFGITPADMAGILTGAQQGDVPELSAPGGGTFAPFEQTPPPSLDTGNVSVDDFGRPIPDVGPPQPFNIPVTQDLPPLELPTSWIAPPASEPMTSGINPGVTFDQVAQSGSPALTPEAIQAAQPNAGARPVVSVPDFPAMAAASGIGGNITVNPVEGFPDFAPQVPFGQVDTSGTPYVPADVFTNAPFGADSLYQGGYGYGPSVQEDLPPPNPLSHAEKFVNQYGASTTLRQVLQNATPDMLQGNSLATVFWALGKGIDTPIDLTDPNFLQQISAAINAGGGWGGDKVVAGLQAAMGRGGPQAITDAAQDVQQDIQEGPGAFGSRPYTATGPAYVGTPQPMEPPPPVPQAQEPNPVPPADIPYNNATAAPPASYDLGAAYGGTAAPAPSFSYSDLPYSFYGEPPSTIQAGYSYLPGSFGEVDPFNFSSAPFPAGGYGGGPQPAPPVAEPVAPPDAQGYGAYNTGDVGGGIRGINPADLSQQLGLGYIDSFLTNFTPAGMQNSGGQPSQDATANELLFPNTDWSKFNPTPSQNVEDVRQSQEPTFAGEQPLYPFPTDTGYGGGFSEAPPPPPQGQAGYNYPPGSFGSPQVAEVPTAPTVGDQGTASAPGDVFQGGPLAGAPGEDLSYTPGTLGFLQGMTSRYAKFGGTAEQLEADARAVAEQMGLNFRVIGPSGDDPRGQLAAIKNALENGYDISALMGFSQGANTLNQIKGDYPGYQYIPIAGSNPNPGFEVPGVSHMNQVAMYGDMLSDQSGQGFGSAPGQTGTPDTDFSYLEQYGGHSTDLIGEPNNIGAEVGGYSKTLADRLEAAGRAYQAATGNDPVYGEADRGPDIQDIYYQAYQLAKQGLPIPEEWQALGASGGIAAPPGRSMHNQNPGQAMDLPSSGFRDWLKAGNAANFGINFPVPGDAPHAQAIPNWQGSLPQQASTPTFDVSGFPQVGPPQQFSEDQQSAVDNAAGIGASFPNTNWAQFEAQARPSTNIDNPDFFTNPNSVYNVFNAINPENPSGPVAPPPDAINVHTGGTIGAVLPQFMQSILNAFTPEAPPTFDSVANIPSIEPTFANLTPQPLAPTSFPDYGGLGPQPFSSPDYGTYNPPADALAFGGFGGGDTTNRPTPGLASGVTGRLQAAYAPFLNLVQNDPQVANAVIAMANQEIGTSGSAYGPIFQMIADQVAGLGLNSRESILSFLNNQMGRVWGTPLNQIGASNQPGGLPANQLAFEQGQLLNTLSGGLNYGVGGGVPTGNYSVTANWPATDPGNTAAGLGGGIVTQTLPVGASREYLGNDRGLLGGVLNAWRNQVLMGNYVPGSPL